jgi:hypothetical protein
MTRARMSSLGLLVLATFALGTLCPAVARAGFDASLSPSAPAGIAYQFHATGASVFAELEFVSPPAHGGSPWTSGSQSDIISFRAFDDQKEFVSAINGFSTITSNGSDLTGGLISALPSASAPVGTRGVSTSFSPFAGGDRLDLIVVEPSGLTSTEFHGDWTTVNPVPEPPTAVMAGAGVLAALAFTWVRSRGPRRSQRPCPRRGTPRSGTAQQLNGHAGQGQFLPGGPALDERPVVLLDSAR